MVWKYFYRELLRLRNEGIIFDLSKGILIHGGGWKKLINEAVEPEEFQQRLKEVCGLDRIHDYYGMVEQTGCIYMQCECGHLHASIYSDVIARRSEDFSECDFGERGILQVVSAIPESYPGHSLLTEDEGVILGEDDCPCGRKGKYFKVIGRLKDAEIRGCSDTFVSKHVKDDLSEEEDDNSSVLDRITYLVGNKDILKDMTNVPLRKPFAESIISFLSDLSKNLMQSKEAKAYPDIVTLGFWLRRTSLYALKERFVRANENSYVGRGVAFHIAPSNVPVNFAYSLCVGLLCGNVNIVRVPSKDFPQVRIIEQIINKTVEEHIDMKPYMCLIRYSHSRKINDILSAMCDVRIIWGGDATIAELRRSVLQPRATEMTFADRYSFAIIDSNEYMNKKEKGRIAECFYNDTYLSDQNACTSPQVIIWTGSRIAEAKGLFWTELNKIVDHKYNFQPIQAVDKLTLGYMAAVSKCGGELLILPHKDNKLVRIQVSAVSADLMEYKGNGGYFYEYDCKDIIELRNLCNDVRCQTIGLVGEKKLLQPLLESGIKGVDRIVPVGHTMDFDFIWDGYNLFERMTRVVII